MRVRVSGWAGHEGEDEGIVSVSDERFSELLSDCRSGGKF